MAYGILGNSSVFVKKEVTEAIYVAPTSAADAVEVLEEGFAFNYTRDVVELNALTGTIEPVAPRAGVPNVEGTLGVYYRASSTAGGAPPSDLLFESLLGGKRQIATTTTTKTGNTTTVLQIQDADIAKFKKGDIVLVKSAGAFEARPISAIDSTLGAANITLAFALESAPADNVVIEKSTTYYPKDNQPTLSVTTYLGAQIEEQIGGIRPVSGELQSWETGSVANWAFSMGGLTYDKVVAAPAFTPDFSTQAQPPVLLSACVWINGVKVPYTSISLSIENTKADLLSACAPQGKVSSRFTGLAVTGEIAPYMDMASVDRFNKFNLNESVSVFGYAYNPTATVGECKEICAFWLPAVKITEMPTGNIDGILTDQMKFSAHKTVSEDTIFLGFI